MDHAICVGADAACNLSVRFLFGKKRREKQALSEPRCAGLQCCLVGVGVVGWGGGCGRWGGVLRHTAEPHLWQVCPPTDRLSPPKLYVSQQAGGNASRACCDGRNLSLDVCSHLLRPYIKQTLSKRTSRNLRGTRSCLAALSRLTRGRGGGGGIYLLGAGWGARLNLLLAHMCWWGARRFEKTRRREPLALWRAFHFSWHQKEKREKMGEKKVKTRDGGQKIVLLFFSFIYMRTVSYTN